MAESARRLGVGVDRVAVRDLSSEIEWAKVSLVTADDYVRACEAIDREPPPGTTTRPSRDSSRPTRT